MYLRDISCCLHHLSFLKLLVVEFFRCEIHLLASEIFDSEPHSAQLNGVELLDLIVKLSLRVFERSNN